MSSIDVVICVVITVVAIMVPIIIFISSKKISISYTSSKYAWFLIDFTSFYMALFLMLLCSELNVEYMQIVQASSMPEVWWVIYIRQGGGVIFVTFFAGILNRMLIQEADLDKWERYSTIYTRINFTIICIVCSYICFLDAKANNCLTDLNNGLLNQSIMWIIVLVESWISFEGLSKPRDKSLEGKAIYIRIREVFLGLVYTIKHYAWVPLLALTAGPISFFILLKVFITHNIEIYELPVKYLIIIMCGFGVMMITTFIIEKYRNPSINRAKKRLNSAIKKSDGSSYKNTVLFKQEVGVLRTEEGGTVKVLKKTVSVGKHNHLSKNKKGKIDDMFGNDIVINYQTEQLDEMVDEMVNDIKTISEKRSELLKECYAQVKDNYFKSVNQE